MSAKQRMLIGDGESSFLFAFKRLFQNLGMVVDTAENIEELENLIKKYNYAFVITDLVLKKNHRHKGFSLIRKIKKKKSRTKVIVITAYGNPKIQQKVLNIGVDLYYEKPVRFKEIRSVLKAMGMYL